MAIIDEIRRSAEESDSTVLKQTELSTHVNITLEVELFVNTRSKFFIDYKDIKVKDIVSLGRRDGWESDNPSWYELINTWIKGLNWRDEVIDYFENDIEDKKFPAEGAGGILEIESLGGLLTCGNGNHRLVGAACWALSKSGDDAILKKVRVASFPLNNYFNQMITILKDDDEIYLLQMSRNINTKINYVKIVNKKLNYINIYELKDDNLVNIGSLKYKYFVINFINNSLQKRDIEMKSLGNYINKIWTPMNKHYFEIMKRNLKNQTTAEV